MAGTFPIGPLMARHSVIPDRHSVIPDRHSVIPGLDPGIRSSTVPRLIPGSGPGMTKWRRSNVFAVAADPSIRRHGRIAPSDSSETLAFRLLISGTGLPEANSERKSDRCTATRLIDPFSRTSTMRHPAVPARVT